VALAICLPCGYVALRAVLNVSVGYVALALMYLFVLRVCGFTGGVDGKPSIEVLAHVRCVPYGYVAL
jgi:hypothetical protein